MQTIYFDMDGTLADLYNINNWLDKLLNEKEKLFIQAKPLLNMQLLARYLNLLQKKGFKIGIISWTPKDVSLQYCEIVKQEKLNWLNIHLSSVNFDEIHIVNYGTNKANFAQNKKTSILFDDNIEILNKWQGIKFNETNIINVLKQMART